MSLLTAYAVVYLHHDGSYSLRSLHGSRACAIADIPLFEGDLVAGIARVEVAATAVSGMQWRLLSAPIEALPASA